MEQFNLLEQPWIKLMVDNKGTIKEVSLLDLFKNSHNYTRLAGETSAQDFAILRFLLSILHTVFSRFNADGKPYQWLKINEKYMQTSEIDDDDEQEYKADLLNTWKSLWESAALPQIINSYLQIWHDRFNLFDDKYPFYQITEENLKSKNIDKTGEINLKFINRLISESNNKVAMFAPACENYKNMLNNASFARWLIAFQGYTGTGDKAKYPDMTVSASKGWLLGLGGVYLLGKNLKETLLLNLNLIINPIKQTPLWEMSLNEKSNSLLHSIPNNLAELYTNWSRLIKCNINNGVVASISAVQLPGIKPHEFFLEQMTLWAYPKTGSNKDHYVPKMLSASQSFWCLFGLMGLKTNAETKQKQPGIIDWHNFLILEKLLQKGYVTIASVGISYNADASTMPNDDIYDELNIYDEVLADCRENGWVPRISEEIDLTKTVIETALKYFAKDITDIRNLKHDGIISDVVRRAYHCVDIPFRNWILEIKYEDNKEETIKKWRSEFKTIIMLQAQDILSTASNRDFIGVNVGSSDKPIILNIEIAYNKFIANLNKILKQ